MRAAAAPALSNAALTITPYITGIDQPTGVRFFGPGEAFVIEKTGTAQFFTDCPRA
jgi:hypothetical protein